MEKKVFKNAYFGKAYKTRDGKLAIYWKYARKQHHLLIKEGIVERNDYGKIDTLLDYDLITVGDIVGEWEEEIDEENKNVNDNVAIYARVSSAENKENLEAQQERLEAYCAARGYKVIKSVAEIGSGLNDNRKKLEQLLLDSNVKKIVVEHSDRFSRFGMNYIIKLLAMQGRYVEVINEQKNDRDDLMQDFVSIITSFCARLYGLRRNKRRTEKIIKELTKETDAESD